MKPLSKVFLVISFLLFTATCSLLTANAAVPHLINYQGRLTDSSGIPLNGSYQLTFRIYDAETAGNMLWEETHAGVVISKGIFSLLLGSVTDLSLPFDKSYWLEIKVANEVMSPRQRIASSAYAFRAEEANKLGGKPPSDYALSTDITSTPTANKAVRLDSNAKLPLAALKVYDSGWFAVTTNTTYTKTHNLGTTKVITQVFLSSSPDGNSNCIGDMSNTWDGGGNFRRGTNICYLSTTEIKIRTGEVIVDVHDANGNSLQLTTGYARVVIMALE